MKIEIVVRMHAGEHPTELTVTTCYAASVDEFQRVLSEAFEHLSKAVPEQFLLDRLEDEL